MGKIIPFPNAPSIPAGRPAFSFQHCDGSMCVTIATIETWWTLEDLELFLRIGQGMLEQAKRERRE
jgi:hypothetical protein